MTLTGDALWNSLPVPTLIVGADRRVRAINPACELFLGTSSRRMEGRAVEDRLAVDAPLEEALARVRAQGGAVFIKAARVSVGNGAPVPCDLQVAPVAGAAGDVLLVLEPRRLSERAGQGRAVKSSARSAVGMAEMLAHEIKNPLAGITGAAQLLAMNLDARDREMTDLIVAESRRIVALLEQVEQFGNLRPPDRAVVNVHDILDRARRSALLGFASGMTISDEYDPSLPPTFVDRDQMIQVVLNLLKNAAEAAGEAGGNIRIRTFYDLGLRLRRQDGTAARLPLQIEIIDDGPGLPPEIAQDIFEPFVSGRENGTGLGLALVSKIISEHEGWITVQSEPGHTVFRISLPVAEPARQTGAGNGARDGGERDRAMDGGMRGGAMDGGMRGGGPRDKRED